MKLLLVDDEEYVIESIKRNLDLTETGVSEVYTAFSVQQAKNIMGMVDIDIVISDIVMPGGTGFDFVEWVRKEELKVQVIFLTSYAEFDYARRAIQLNSVDYLLKPIDFEKLKAAVQRAAESVAKEKKIQDLRQESIKWNQNRKILQQDIWKNVLKSGFSEEKFCETAAQRQLSYGPGHYFRLICLMPEIKSNKREMWDTATMEFVIENVLSELYEETDIAVDTVFYQEPGIYWIVTQSREKAFPQDGGRDCEILQQFVAWMNEKIYPELWCGAGQWESVLGMQKQSRNLQKMREGSLSVRNEVLFLNEFQAPQTSYENKELDVWKALLSEEKPEELLERLQKYLDRTEREGMINYQRISGSAPYRSDPGGICMAFGTGDQGVCTVCRCGYGKPASEFPLWQRRDDGICRGTGSESSSVQTVHQQIRFGYESGMRLYRCTLPGGDSPGGAWGACLFEYGLSVPDF